MTRQFGKIIFSILVLGGLFFTVIGQVPKQGGSSGSSIDTATRHLIGNSSTPTILEGSGAGTSPTVSITGTDIAGAITVGSGTLPGTGGTIATVTFGTAFSSAPYCVFSPNNAATALLTGVTQPLISINTTTFALVAGPTAIGAATTYKWTYVCAQ